MDKPRVLKDYESLDDSVVELIKLHYHEGFEQHLLKILSNNKKYVSVLPFETDDKHYLIRMTSLEARELIEEDDDYDEFGNLKDYIRDEYEEKHSDD